ncbi:restriction endonuclease subunit S [uncultured Desulfovibrio sp.]|uniref:restriction endonuclease subunit S n=1 Tax=uncultured Desulfovibrio sp. TaxID=167968 RepID=UPI0026066AA5|nr:restriction endonuclease subunit S [uncultured Desulfovibrio sp.]
MRQMKDSGIEWIGEIPAEWEVNPLFSLFEERKCKNIKLKESNVLSLSYGKIIKRDIETNMGLLPESFETYNIVETGNIILRLTDLQNDKTSLRTGLVTKRGIITSAYIAIENKNNVQSSFFSYLLHTYDTLKVFYMMGNGVRQNLKFAELSRLPLLIPSIPEQRSIADYLDAQCARIDETMELVRQSREKLRAYKLSLITEAVTRGLDPDVPMKDSGVPWIGEIPAGWKKIRLKYLTQFIIDCPHETPAYDTDGIYFVIRTADQDVGTLKSQEKMYRLSYGEYIRRTRRAKLEKNDIIYGREGERWGLACIVPESDTYCLGQRVMQFRCSKKYNSRFIMWQLNSHAVYLQGIKDTLGSTSPHVNISTITNFLLMCPPLDEQQRIAAYLDEKCARIDALLAEKDELLDKLAEYKKSLIFECVTGKREVAA